MLLAVAEVWNVVLIAFLFLILLRTGKTECRCSEPRIRRLEAKLDLVLRHLGLEYKGPELPAELKATLADASSKIDAIKRVRSSSGLGLKEAKELVDQHWETERGRARN